MDCSLKGWLPFNLEYIEGNWLIFWLFLGDTPINHPFFDETILTLKIKKGGSRYISCTSLNTFLNTPLPQDTVPLTAFIFHVSRCGSTLLSQALVQNKKYLVIPEAPIFDQILRMKEHDNTLRANDIENIFTKTVAWYGQNKNKQYSNYFIKLDSWHIHFYEQLRKFYATIPFYFLTREPLAILKSHIKKRGIHSIPNYISPQLLRIAIKSKHFQDFNAYTEEVITNYYLKNIEIVKKHVSLNHFYDFSFGAQNMLADFYNKVLGNEKIPFEVENRLKTHSKDADLKYNGDITSDYELQLPEISTQYKKLLKEINR